MKEKVYQRPNPRPAPISVYLGVEQETERRKEKLRRLAVALIGEENISGLIKALADGEFDDKLLEQEGE